MSSATRADKPSLEIAIRYLRQGEKEIAHKIIQQLVKLEPDNIQAWAWLAYIAEDIEQKRAALRRAYRLDPADKRIQDALARLTGPRHIRQAAQNGVFISYARPDELFAFDLAQNLRDNGVKTWVDMTDIPDDDDWHSAVKRALDYCGLMLVVLTPAALSTSDLRRERHYFVNAGKLILPLLRAPGDFKAHSMWLEPVDFRQSDAEGLQRLLGMLVADAALHR